jgi:N-terminal TM domain of oligopeptide transport permease C
MTTLSLPSRPDPPTPASPFGRRRNVPQEILRSLLGQPVGVIGLVLTAAVILVAVAAPVIAPHDPLTTDPGNALAGPSGAHWLGTDEVGRDVLSRLIYGSAPALEIGTLAVLVGGLIGIGIGVAAGYYRGVTEEAGWTGACCPRRGRAGGCRCRGSPAPRRAPPRRTWRSPPAPPATRRCSARCAG